MKIALIAGSTGLIGRQLLDLLLQSDRYYKVVAITRRDINISNPKLVQLKLETNNIGDLGEALTADDVFCCLGTTMAKARSKEKFYEVDYKFTLSLARITFGRGAKQFLLVSALGADWKSPIFYNRVKGEIELVIGNIGFKALHIFRPSLLLGERTEKRAGEDAAKFVYRILWFLIPAKYKAIDAIKVAKAMLDFASREQEGVFVHESREMQHF